MKIVSALKPLPSPNQLLIIGWLSWLFFWIISRIRFEDGVSNKSLGLLASYSAIFLVGSKFAQLLFKAKNQRYTIRNSSLTGSATVVNIFALMGISGGLLNLYNQLNLNLASTLLIANARAIKNASDPGLRLQDLGTPLLCLGHVSFLAFYLTRKQSDLKTKILSLLALFFLLLNLLLAGGRTLLPVLLVSLILIQILNSYSTQEIIANENKGKKYLLIVFLFVLCVILFLLYTYFLMTGRLQQQGFSSLFTYLRFFENSRGIYTPDYISNVISSNGSDILIIFAFLAFLLFYYVTHGVFEFSRTINWISDTQPSLGYGDALFGSIGVALRPFLTDMPSSFYDAPSNGRYTTLFGSFTYDFGIIGAMIAILIFSFVATRWYITACQNSDIASKIRYVVLSPVILFAPVFDCFGGAGGFYTLISAQLFFFLHRSMRI